MIYGYMPIPDLPPSFESWLFGVVEISFAMVHRTRVRSRRADSLRLGAGQWSESGWQALAWKRRLRRGQFTRSIYARPSEGKPQGEMYC